MAGPGVVLLVVVFAAFVVESSLGFGATVVTVVLGSQLLPLDALLPAFVPVNIALSGYLVARHGRHVDRGLLLRQIAPAMIAGLPLGLAAFRWLPESPMRRTLGALVMALAAVELWRMTRTAGAPRAPLGRWRALVTLFAAGVVHGAFATGGPLAVYVVGRAVGDDKARFRGTLSALWLVLNVILLCAYGAMHRLSAVSAQRSATLVLPLVAGLAAGEAIHARVSMRVFERAVFALLGVAGLVAIVRG